MKSQLVNSNAILTNRPLSAQIKHARRDRTRVLEQVKGWFKKFSTKRGFADLGEQRRFEENLTQQRMSARIFP